jgi:chitinase
MKKILLIIGALVGASLISAHTLAVDCSNLAEWNSGTQYTQGTKVKYSNRGYTANYWSENKIPANFSGPWQEWIDNGACDTTTVSSSSIRSSIRSSSVSSSIVHTSSSVVHTSSSVSSSTSSGGGSCRSYVAGTSYALNEVVTNAGGSYICNIPGWCSLNAAWAYAPGTGQYWQSAWTAGGSCSGASSSSSIVVSSSSIRSSSSSIRSSNSSSSYVDRSSYRICVGSSSSAPSKGRDLVGYWENWQRPLEIPSTIPNYTVHNKKIQLIEAD